MCGPNVEMKSIMAFHKKQEEERKMSNNDIDIETEIDLDIDDVNNINESHLD